MQPSSRQSDKIWTQTAEKEPAKTKTATDKAVKTRKKRICLVFGGFFLGLLGLCALSRAVCVQQGAPFLVQCAPHNRTKPALTRARPRKGPRSKPKRLQKEAAETKTATDKTVKPEKNAFVWCLVVSFFVGWPFGPSQGPSVCRKVPLFWSNAPRRQPNQTCPDQGAAP